MRSGPRRYTESEFWEKAVRNQKTGCLEWQTKKNKYGYGVINYHRKRWLAHRLAWALTHGDPGRKHVLHDCDKPSCIEPRHLWLGTQRQNNQDCSRKFRTRGLDRPTVQMIRQLYKFRGPFNLKVLANLFGVHKDTIFKLIHRKNKVDW